MVEYIKNDRQLIFAQQTLEALNEEPRKPTVYYTKHKEQTVIKSSNINYPKHNCTDFDW